MALHLSIEQTWELRKPLSRASGTRFSIPAAGEVGPREQRRRKCRCGASGLRGPRLLVPRGAASRSAQRGSLPGPGALAAPSPLFPRVPLPPGRRGALARAGGGGWGLRAGGRGLGAEGRGSPTRRLAGAEPGKAASVPRLQQRAVWLQATSTPWRPSPPRKARAPEGPSRGLSRARRLTHRAISRAAACTAGTC